jgi:Butirosin biosynthesis protein H, N-terminal
VITHTGKAEYCYANAASMLLAGIGEQQAPQLIEVLTGVGLGAILEPGDVLYLSQVPPDIGLNHAFDRLGIHVQEHASVEDAEPPWQELAAALGDGSALLGPVDLAHLPYVPWPPEEPGADHYVLAYALRDGEVWLHDPYGFPHVHLSLAALERAWRADSIAYRRGRYRWWSAPRRERVLTATRVAEAALRGFHHDYQAAASGPWATGTTAIHQTATTLREGGLDAGRLGLLREFVLPLGAARASHYAAFFAEHGHDDLARIKDQQAQLLGAVFCDAAGSDLAALGDGLERLADLEASFTAALATAVLP